MNSIAEKLQKIRDFINIQRNINNNSVEIIAVTKNFNKDSVAEALESGISSFGENRVQEAIHKYSKLKTQHQNISLHMIGPLQTNKVKLALSIFDVIQTLDREKLVKEVVKNLSPESITKKFFIQVNIGDEEQKSGIKINNTVEFVRWCKNDLNLNIVGLMCIPPINSDSKKHFLCLKKFAQMSGVKYLSMGMSDDYEIAIKCGATHIRLGTFFFGKRKY
tara:strand:+ start:10020 stop:10679 length:660 start_codon:yes stop_codon:yes gene_type:complete